MSLFPSSVGYSSSDTSFQNMMEHAYAEAVTLNLSMWGEGDTDTRFRAGDQQLYNDLYGNIPNIRRKTFNFNKINVVCNMITGYQRQHQKKIIAIPRTQNDQRASDQFTKLFYWSEKEASIQMNISNCFDACLTTGMTLAHLWWDFRSDPISGDPRIDVLYFSDFLIDPFFRKQDLSDCNYIWRRKWLSPLEAASLLPEYYDEILSMHPVGNEDGKFYFQPETYNTNYNTLLTYDEYYYRTMRDAKTVVDTTSGDTLEWKSSAEMLKIFLLRFPQMKVIDQKVPSVEVGILVNGKLFYRGALPTGDKYPFVPFICYYEPQMAHFPSRIRGVVRDLRDAQYLYNRRKIIELDIFESQINSGWVYKPKSLVNPKDVFLTGQGRGIAVKDNADIGDISRIEAPRIDPSMMMLSESLGKEIMSISGVNEELLGAAEDDKAGILSQLRQSAGIVTLQKIFDQLDYSIKQIGNILLEAIQINFTPGKVQRIIEEEPDRQFYEKFFSKYDCQIEEGANTTTQKQLELGQLLHARELGIPVPSSSILKVMQIQNKNELIEEIKAIEQQQMQMAQAEAQSQTQVQSATVQSLQARALYDQSGATERMSRIEENKMLAVERVSEAQKDHAKSLLDTMKALKEMDQMDVETIMKGLELLRQVEDQKVGDERNRNAIP